MEQAGDGADVTWRAGGCSFLCRMDTRSPALKTAIALCSDVNRHSQPNGEFTTTARAGNERRRCLYDDGFCCWCSCARPSDVSVSTEMLACRRVAIMTWRYSDIGRVVSSGRISSARRCASPSIADCIMPMRVPMPVLGLRTSRCVYAFIHLHLHRWTNDSAVLLPYRFILYSFADVSRPHTSAKPCMHERYAIRKRHLVNIDAKF